MKLDSNGFVILADGRKSGMAMVDLGGLLDLMWRRFNTEKWYIIFFPLDGFYPIYSKIEEEFYTPSTDRNKGYEILPLLDRNTTIVMCYKEWMTPKQLGDLMRKIGDANKNEPFIPMNQDLPSLEIPEGKDVAFITVKNESPMSWNMRLDFFREFNDYCKKQQTGT